MPIGSVSLWESQLIPAKLWNHGFDDTVFTYTMVLFSETLNGVLSAVIQITAFFQYAITVSTNDDPTIVF